jgi:D-amino-acid dehydrogenase
VFKRAVKQSVDTPEIGDVKILSGLSAQELFPPLREDKAAVHITGAARVDGRLMAAALRRAAVKAGAAELPGTARLLMRDGRVRGAEVGGEVIEGDTVVAAAGAWTGGFVAGAATVRTEPQRGQIMRFSLPGTDTSRWPVILPTSTGHYMLAFDGGRIVAGATREAGSGFDYRMTAGGLAEVLSEALGVAPGLAGAEVAETRIGFRPMGPDIRPLLGPVPGADGLVIATGLGASGLTMGPRAGAVAARVALGTDPLLGPGEDLAAFDPLR